MILPEESLTLPLEGLSWVTSVPLRALGLGCPEQTALLMPRGRLRTLKTRSPVVLRGAWGG